jgi:hypothetical protein
MSRALAVLFQHNQFAAFFPAIFALHTIRAAGVPERRKRPWKNALTDA